MKYELRGRKELEERLMALRGVFKPIGKNWQSQTMRLARGRVKVVTGATKKSIRRRSSTDKRASVQASHGARFLDQGTEPHAIQAGRVPQRGPRAVSFRAMGMRPAKAMYWTQNGHPMFRKKVRHPGGQAHPFLRNSARDAIDDVEGANEVIRAWNNAGRSQAGLFSGKAASLGF